jgi:hypothetical protein
MDANGRGGLAMKRTMIRGRSIWLLSGLLAGGLVAGAIAYAAIPDSNKQIHVCYRAGDTTKAGGATLSVIDSENGGSCKAGDTETTFTKQGLVTGDEQGTSVGLGANPQPQGSTAQVTTANATKLFVFGRIDATVTCNPNTACSRSYGIFVDGNTVQDAGAVVDGDEGREQLAVFGMVSVGAGSHTIEFRTHDSPDVATSTSGLNVGGIALGG